jgi:peroxiredoxin
MSLAGVNRVFILCVPVLLLMLVQFAAGENQKTRDNRPLETVQFAVPNDASDRAYLGVPPSGTFTISQIKAPIVLIEILSAYCPHCQQTAPRMNEVYREIEKNPQLRGKIRIVGVGMQNSDFEVNTFRQKYAIPFPILSDNTGEFSGRLYVQQTPTFVGIRLSANGKLEEFFSNKGEFYDTAKFTMSFLAAAGLDQETGEQTK